MYEINGPTCAGLLAQGKQNYKIDEHNTTLTAIETRVVISVATYDGPLYFRGYVDQLINLYESGAILDNPGWLAVLPEKLSMTGLKKHGSSKSQLNLSVMKFNEHWPVATPLGSFSCAEAEALGLLTPR